MMLATEQDCLGCEMGIDLGIFNCPFYPYAEMRARYKIQESGPFAEADSYEKVTVPNCYRQPGKFVFFEQIPVYAR